MYLDQKGQQGQWQPQSRFLIHFTHCDQSKYHYNISPEATGLDSEDVKNVFWRCDLFQGCCLLERLLVVTGTFVSDQFFFNEFAYIMIIHAEEPQPPRCCDLRRLLTSSGFHSSQRFARRRLAHHTIKQGTHARKDLSHCLRLLKDVCQWASCLVGIARFCGHYYVRTRRFRCDSSNLGPRNLNIH